MTFPSEHDSATSSEVGNHPRLRFFQLMRTGIFNNVRARKEVLILHRPNATSCPQVINRYRGTHHVDGGLHTQASFSELTWLTVA